MDRILSTDPHPPEVAAAIGVTVMTGNYYDELLPSSLNRAWSRSAQHLISRIPNCKHLVINGADRNMIYRHPEQVVGPINRLIKQRRRTEKMAKKKREDKNA